ncbi:MAG TPA: aminotransferase class V-fold PLP-dependent enzyme [Phycisphaerae bacterium]|nr:aminotransferase class V-fold PLP-dependent enzyme [Phycisphaerae bacterium]
MPHTRRTFLRYAVGATAAGYAFFRGDSVDQVRAAVSAAGDTPPDRLAGDEDFWFEVQQAYTVDRSLINLNNGGVSPSPRVVQDAMRRHLEFSNQAPSKNMWEVLKPQVESVRRRLARHFGCDPEEMAITRNTSEALENAIFGIDLKPGDEILTTSQDYPRMLNSWKQRELRDGVVLKMFPVPAPAESPEQYVDLFEQHITPRTRVILLCHTIFLTGQILPVADVCRMARQRGILTIVDGAHAFAHFAFKGGDIGCDYYGTSLHKWLCAPHGTGFLYVRKDRIAETWPLMAGNDPHSKDIRKFEEIGTHPIANRLAISEALTFYEALGGRRKEARLRYLRDRFARRLDQHPKVKTLTNLDPAHSCGIATLSFEGLDPGELMNHLWKRHRIIVVAIKHEEVNGLRISPNVYTTPREIDIFCDAVEGVLEKGLPT